MSRINARLSLWLISTLFIVACSHHTTEPGDKEPGWQRADIVQSVDRAALWQLAHMDNFESYVPSLVSRTEEPRGWVQGAFYLGLVQWAETTGQSRYFDYLRQHGEAQGWRLGDRTYHADDHVIAQYYLYLYDYDSDPDILKPVLSEFQHILDNPPTSSLDFEPKGKLAAQDYEHDCQKRWCWADALFMSPPVWFHLYAITDDEKYADYAHREYVAVTDYLLDDEYNLYFRDSRFFDRRHDNGKKIFWSRGNGWVYSGLANVIDLLPENDPRRDWYIDLFKRMSASLIELQATNGYWPVSLAAGDLYSVPETSGTAFFIAGLAWGVNNGILDADQYNPVIQKGWQSLLQAQRKDGMLGYVQQIGFGPDEVAPDHTHLYGAGAFLLAGVQMLKWVEQYE